jgi:glutamate-1-semialdehyde aminotransferase
VTAYAASLQTDWPAWRELNEALVEAGVHVIPRGLMYVSTAHTEADLADTRERVRSAVRRVVTQRELSAAGAP